MSEIAWETECSVESRSSLEFAWAYMSNVANWDDPPATFELEGPFTSGSRGITRTPGQEPRPWRLAEVRPRESYTIETEFDGASMSFEWRFARASGGTRLTQHLILKGQKAAAYRPQVEAAFASNLEAGMRRISSAIEQAEARSGRLDAPIA